MLESHSLVPTEDPYLAATGGVGTGAEAIVIGALDKVLQAPGFELLKRALGATPFGHELSTLIRSWQAIPGVDTPGQITLGCARLGNSRSILTRTRPIETYSLATHLLED